MKKNNIKVNDKSQLIITKKFKVMFNRKGEEYLRELQPYEDEGDFKLLLKDFITNDLVNLGSVKKPNNSIDKFKYKIPNNKEDFFKRFFEGKE